MSGDLRQHFSGLGSQPPFGDSDDAISRQLKVAVAHRVCLALASRAMTTTVDLDNESLALPQKINGVVRSPCRDQDVGLRLGQVACCDRSVRIELVVASEVSGPVAGERALQPSCSSASIEQGIDLADIEMPQEVGFVNGPGEDARARDDVCKINERAIHRSHGNRVERDPLLAVNRAAGVDDYAARAGDGSSDRNFRGSRKLPEAPKVRRGAVTEYGGGPGCVHRRQEPATFGHERTPKCEHVTKEPMPAPKFHPSLDAPAGESEFAKLCPGNYVVLRSRNSSQIML